jgi:hypothetical protein
LHTKTLFLAKIMMMMPSRVRLTYYYYYYYGEKGETMIPLSITKLECSNRELHAIGSRPDGPYMFFLSCSKFLQGKYCLLIYHLLLGHEYISKAIYIYIYIYI